MTIAPDALWQSCLQLIQDNVTSQQYETWFKPIVFESYNDATKTLLVQVPSPFVYEYLEENYVDLLSKVLKRVYGQAVQLTYRIVTDKANHMTVDLLSDTSVAQTIKPQPQTKGNLSPSLLDAQMYQEIDSQLNPRQTFESFIEGDSNKLPRALGLSIAQKPFTNRFNPMFIYGPSGCGKTHLVNAMGVCIKQHYSQSRVLYVSARLFQVQYTNAVRSNTLNDFINFYQTIDVLIVDDIQEWATAQKTQDTFFHIFDHLVRNGRRIILASDRPPVDLKGMNERLITRFSCGLIAELERPDVQLCRDILNNKIKHDGLNIPEEVVDFIANTANGSVRDLEGVVNSLMAYSVVYNSNVDMKLAARVMKRAVKVDNKPLTIDDIVDKVCNHFNVKAEEVSGKSRKHDLVVARQVSMYLALKYTKMPASRVGKLIAGRDHSTVIHSCEKVTERMKVDRNFCDEINSIESSFQLKNRS